MLFVARITRRRSILLALVFAGLALLPARAQEDAASNADDPKLAGHFSGRVMGPDAKPVSGARVFVVPLSHGLDGQLAAPMETRGDTAARAETDCDGRFEFDASEMTLTDFDGLPTRRKCIVMATAEGFAPDWIELRGRTRSTRIQNPVKGTDLALELALDDVPIRGRLLDPDGRPLAGARVRLTRLSLPKHRDLDAYLNRVAKLSILSGVTSSELCERELWWPHLMPGLLTETKTDTEGRFALFGLGRDRIAGLKVSAPGVVNTALSVMTREGPEAGAYVGIEGKPTQVIHGADFALQLKRGLTVSGLVLDHESHEPIAGMWVGLRDPRANSLAERIVTDEHGRFMITGLDPQLLGWQKPYRAVVAVSPPGLQYQASSGEVVNDASPVVIECQRGIGFFLKLVDQQGQAIEADVTYCAVLPNPYAPREENYPSRWPVSQAARNANGTYQGFVVPGPGAVLVKTPGRLDLRPAAVDPKEFFAAGRTQWTAQERLGAYGTKDIVATSMGYHDQNDYAAIVLVNPQPGSEPLELEATVVKATPRRVSLVDTEGRPVVGVKTQGMTMNPYDNEPPLRAATFRLINLHPNRVRRITFYKDDRTLIGFLAARGDGDMPYTVRMQPWGTVVGRIVDENGKGLKASLSADKGSIAASDDPEIGIVAATETDSDGRFRIDRMVPGQRYSVRVYSAQGRLTVMAFEKLVLSAGEVRDLGDIRLKPSLVAMSGTTRLDYPAP